MREPPGPCGAGRLRCVWLCGAWPLCVPVGGGPPRGLFCWAWPLCVPVGGGPPRGLFCWAGPLCVPAGGGPPARSPHASLRLGVVDLEARPGPAAAHRHRGLAPQAPRRPPIGRCSLSVRCRPGPAAAHRHRGLAHHHPAALASSPHTPHFCTDTQFRMQFPRDYFKP